MIMMIKIQKCQELESSINITVYGLDHKNWHQLCNGVIVFRKMM